VVRSRSSLISISFLLVRHPKVFESLRLEITSICAGTARLQHSDLQSMSYLQNVLKESKSLSSLLLALC
jgi:hypothetical protein